jgi:hypothetical protein
MKGSCKKLTAQMCGVPFVILSEDRFWAEALEKLLNSEEFRKTESLFNLKEALLNDFHHLRASQLLKNLSTKTV